MSDAVLERFLAIAPAVEACALRLVEEQSEVLTVQRDVLAPVRTSLERGAMITVRHRGGVGYAATSDLSPAGLRRAAERARTWAERSAGLLVPGLAGLRPPRPVGAHAGPCERPWAGVPLADKVALLQRASARLHADPRIADWNASLWSTRCRSLLASADGARAEQEIELLAPELSVLAAEGGEVQRRSWAGQRGNARQGGLELLERLGFERALDELPAEALELLAAPDCPSGRMELLLAPDQMMLQVHESIGHPLELDRILGDERNYAGTSFVRPEMFGRYRYGSELLDVTFDPTLPGEFAGYAWDDEGSPATREHLIRGGILVRGLGGAASQARSGLPGVACARAQSWHRPPIDRMANLNVEPGASSFAELVGRVRLGVYMRANASWSIDDSRNKFQFGCEQGRMIRDGQLCEVVKNPNYRGISESFWRNLVGLGDASTVGVHGTPFCGKGEPNQIMRVGHACPVGLFADVEIFGGAG